MQNEEKKIKKKSRFFPDIYIDSILSVTPEYLEKNNIKGIIIDMDNTVIDRYVNILDGIDKWHKNIKKHGIKTIMVTNSCLIPRVKKVAKFMDIEYIYWGLKPTKFGLNLAKKKLNLNANEIAVIGDQIFTDVWGANRAKMHSILVKPILEEKKSFYTKNRYKIEKKIIKKFLETQNNE